LADLVFGVGFANPLGKNMPVAQHPLLAPRFYIAYQLAFFRVTAFDVHVIRHQVFHGVVFKPYKVFRMPRFFPMPGRKAICAGYY
jgi:hypothetical protein